jgi:hypothetical protein
MTIQTPAEAAAVDKSWLIVANEVLRLNPKQIKALTSSDRKARVIGLRGYIQSQTCNQACAALDKDHEWH